MSFDTPEKLEDHLGTGFFGPSSLQFHALSCLYFIAIHTRLAEIQNPDDRTKLLLVDHINKGRGNVMRYNRIGPGSLHAPPIGMFATFGYPGSWFFMGTHILTQQEGTCTDTPGTAGGPGGHDRTLAIKS